MPLIGPVKEAKEHVLRMLKTLILLVISWEWYERRLWLIEKPRGVGERMFFISFLFSIFFCGRKLQGLKVDMEAWEVSGIGVHDINFPKNRFKKLYTQKKTVENLGQVI